MDWREHIVSDERILLGKLCIKGTRLSVELLLELMQIGWSDELLLEGYINLKPVHLEAVRAYQTEYNL